MAASKKPKPYLSKQKFIPVKKTITIKTVQTQYKQKDSPDDSWDKALRGKKKTKPKTKTGRTDKQRQKILDIQRKFNEYKKSKEEYFSKARETLISNNVSYKEIWFSDVIQETFNIENFLY